MTDWVCLVLVIAAYVIGQFSGYRLCKFRMKNIMLRRIRSAHARPHTLDNELTGYERLLPDVMKL